MKRLLSLDGGGIRGIFSIQIVRKIESIYRRAFNNDGLVLSDVIDFFAGTSTGAIIATCLCWGMSADDIENLFLSHNRIMFENLPWYKRWKAKYNAQKLEGLFKEIFAEPTGSPALLGSKKLKKLLMIVTRNATTGSPWPISNNPDAMYNSRELNECNLKIVKAG